MKWVRHHDLLIVVFGAPVLAACLQWAGVFHV